MPWMRDAKYDGECAGGEIRCEMVRAGPWEANTPDWTKGMRFAAKFNASRGVTEQLIARHHFGVTMATSCDVRLSTSPTVRAGPRQSVSAQQWTLASAAWPRGISVSDRFDSRHYPEPPARHSACPLATVPDLAPSSTSGLHAADSAWFPPRASIVTVGAGPELASACLHSCISTSDLSKPCRLWQPEN